MTAWCLANSAEITNVAGMIGAVCAALLGLIALTTKMVNCALLIYRNRQDRRQRDFDSQFAEAFDGDELP